MDADRWPLTREAIEADEQVLDAGEDLSRGFTLLDLLAARPGSGVIKARDGVYLAGDPEGAKRLLAEHDAFRRRMMGPSRWPRSC